MKKERRSKQGRIAQLLRERIVGGEFSPGELLPSRLQLAAELGISTITLQGEFDRLAEDGFVDAKGSQGTFVSPRPPHLSQYGLVFHSHPQLPAWGRFAQVLLNEAAAIERAGEIKVPCYFGIEGHSDTEDYQKLLRDVKQHRLAGVIFTDSSPAEHLQDTALIEQSRVPLVAIMGPSALRIPTVEMDVPGFFDRAIEHLIGRGRRSIAVLSQTGPGSEMTVREDLDRIMALPGIIHKPYWRQYLNVFDPAAVRNAVHLLFHPEQTTRPDALIVTDDTMLDATTFGLIAAGIRVPQDVEVVSHFNFPVQSAAQVHVTRLGFDSRLILGVCLDTIDRQRNGEELRGTTRVVPVAFEHELKVDLPPQIAAIGSIASQTTINSDGRRTVEDSSSGAPRFSKGEQDADSR